MALLKNCMSVLDDLSLYASRSDISANEWMVVLHVSVSKTFYTKIWILNVVCGVEGTFVPKISLILLYVCVWEPFITAVFKMYICWRAFSKQTNLSPFGQTYKINRANSGPNVLCGKATINYVPLRSNRNDPISVEISVHTIFTQPDFCLILEEGNG